MLRGFTCERIAGEMGTILHMVRELSAPPDPKSVQGVRLDTYRGAEDLADWLKVREEAFADQLPPVRRWTSRLTI